jgi:multiple sugar transport system ATP-binding protein
VAIGRALVREAEVFLFDEPLSNLDAKLRTELRRELKQLHHELGATMIYVTHDQVEAMTLATRVAVMRGGRIQQIGPPAEVYAKPRNMFVAGFLGAPTMNFIEGLLVARPDAPASPAVLGVRPEHVRLHGPGHGGKGAAAFASAQVALIEPLGASDIVWLDMRGQRIAASVPADGGWVEGTIVGVEFDLARACVFDPRTEARIDADPTAFRQGAST